MKGYVDVFCLTVPKKNLTAYKSLARRFAKLAASHGALECREFLAEDINGKYSKLFPKMMKLQASEVLIFSVVEYRSRKHRDQVNKALMTDPKMLRMMKEKPLFDPKKMAYGGFETMVKM